MLAIWLGRTDEASLSCQWVAIVRPSLKKRRDLLSLRNLHFYYEHSKTFFLFLRELGMIGSPVGGGGGLDGAAMNGHEMKYNAAAAAAAAANCYSPKYDDPYARGEDETNVESAIVFLK